MNKELIARNFGRRAANYENEARLQVMVAQELISQCREFKGSVLDLGAGPGIIAKHSEWDVTSLDISLEMCNLAPGKAVNADAENIPFSPQSFANVVSSLSLQWLISLENVLGEVNRILKPGGKFSFTTFAPSSLKDLRAAFSYIDANQHIMEFERAIKLFAILKKVGFTNLVMSSQKISFHYDNMLSALRSIKNIGAGYNFSAHKNLHGKGYFTRLENVYKSLVKAQDQVPLHWEVLYIHAEKPM